MIALAFVLYVYLATHAAIGEALKTPCAAECVVTR